MEESSGTRAILALGYEESNERYCAFFNSLVALWSVFKIQERRNSADFISSVAARTASCHRPRRRFRRILSRNMGEMIPRERSRGAPRRNLEGASHGLRRFPFERRIREKPGGKGPKGFAFYFGGRGGGHRGAKLHELVG